MASSSSNSDNLAHWKREGYTHLHLGGVRLILTLYGRKGLPVTARLALLDTRFKEYQHVVIGTVLTTLHARSVLITFYPNFNLSLDDPNLPITLKVQIQIQGAEQTVSSKMATLHHQLVYRLQNHAFDLSTPQTTSDALMILTDSSDSIPSIVQIPRQIQKQELLNLMPLEWLSNYEKFHQNSQLVQTSDAHFEKRADGMVKLIFQSPSTSQTPPIVSHPPYEQLTPRNSFSYSSMITVVSTAQENLPIYGFASDGYLIYQTNQCQPMLHSIPIQSCIMFSSSSYQERFPPLEKQTDPQTKVTTKPFVHSPVTLNGQLEEPKPFEAVINWQTQNARAQNSAFRSLDEKIEKVASQVKQTDTKIDRITTQLEHMYFDMQNRVSQLDSDLSSMIQNRYWVELARIDADKQPLLFEKSPALPLHTPTFSTYQPFYTPSTSRKPVDYAKLFGLSHLKHAPSHAPSHAPPKPRTKSPKPEPPPTYHQPSDPQSSPEPQSP
ncbi:hypothetical protein KPL70_003561 [Citrus sinensis]|nr:hypothetical protein KPL70_003561 [Citrus sinensis]